MNKRIQKAISSLTESFDSLQQISDDLDALRDNVIMELDDLEEILKEQEEGEETNE